MTREETLDEKLDRIGDIVVLLRELEEKVTEQDAHDFVVQLRVEYEREQENVEDAYRMSPEYAESHPNEAYFYLVHNREVW